MENDKLTEQMDEIIEQLGYDVDKTDVGSDKRTRAVKDYVETYKARVDQYKVETELFYDVEEKHNQDDNEKKRLAWMRKDTLIKVGVVGGITVVTIVAENAGGYVSKALSGLTKLIK